MINLMLLNLIFILISFLILLINKFISMIKLMNREKNTPFECGFDPFTTSRLPFSIKFFLITLIFLIFDLEIIILIPLIFLLKFFYLKWSILMILIFTFFLIFSLMMEWLLNYLQWIN